MNWLTKGLLGDAEGDGPQWPWAAKAWDRWDEWADNTSPDDEEE